MVTLIDIEKGKRSSKRRFILHIVFVSILSILVIGGSVASLLLSRLDYDLNLILNIVVDALYIIFIIFYFINVFPVVYHYYNLFRNMNNVSLEKRRHLVYLKEIVSNSPIKKERMTTLIIYMFLITIINLSLIWLTD